MEKKSYSINEAQKLLENYCAYQERSHKEVVEKLKKINNKERLKAIIKKANEDKKLK